MSLTAITIDGDAVSGSEDGELEVHVVDLDGVQLTVHDAEGPFAWLERVRMSFSTDGAVRVHIKTPRDDGEGGTAHASIEMWSDREGVLHVGTRASKVITQI